MEVGRNAVKQQCRPALERFSKCSRNHEYGAAN